MPRIPYFSLTTAVLALVSAAAASAADVRVTDVELSYFTRARGGWAQADAPATGGMVAIRCTYELVADRTERSAEWTLAFVRGQEELRRATGGTLADPATGRASRTWYGLIAQPGSHEVGCVADPDNVLAETDERNNRLMRTFDVPGEASGVARRTPLVSATASQAAAVRGAAPALDVAFLPSAIRRAAQQNPAESESVTTATVGESLLVDCGYRAHVDSVHGEPMTLAPWTIRLERDGALAAQAPGVQELVHSGGATAPQHLTEAWTPTAPGRYVFRCVLDPDGALAETDRSNNALELAIDVVPAGSAVAQTLQETEPSLPPAQLGFIGYTPQLTPVIGPVELTIYESTIGSRALMWDSPIAAQFEWRWQAALAPFSDDPTAEQPELLAAGAVPQSSDRTFYIDIGSFPPLGEAPKQGTTGPPGNVAVAIPGTSSAPSARSGVVQSGPAAAPQNAAAQPPQAAPGASARAVPDRASPVRAGAAAASASQPQSSATAVQAAGVGALLDPSDMPLDIYIRIVPLVDGKPSLPGSNFVVAHYVPGTDPVQQAIGESLAGAQQAQQKLAEMSEAARVFNISLASFEQPIFADPSKWGCVKILQNPHQGKLHPAGPYAVGSIVCPEKDEQYMEKSWDEQVWEGIKGFGHAWNELAELWDYGKAWVAEKLAEALPCEWLGEDLESDCESAAEILAVAAMNVGLAAAGIPPTLPDLEGMGELAEGEFVDGAVEYTCKAIESEGGECTPEMRDALAKTYAEGLDEMQKLVNRQSSEPACGNAEEAKALGVKPLPCFTEWPGVEVEPAPGAVDRVPAAVLTVARTKPDPEFPLECGLAMGMTFSKPNVPGFPGGPVSAQLWASGYAPLPPLGVGQSAQVRVELGYLQPFKLVGQQGQSIDWWGLLRGSTASLSINAVTTQAIAPGPNGPVSLSCSNHLTRTVHVPQAVTAQWTVQ